MTYIKTASSTGYQRKWEDYTFPADTRCIELVDYVGEGQGDWNAYPGNAWGVHYTRAESFYRAFANATFGGPCIVDIGELPADRYSNDGEPLTDTRISMAAAFTGSDLQILPHGCSRGLIDNCNDTFRDCVRLRAWSPSEMVAAGIAGVTDPAAPRILRSNGIARHAFLMNLRPATMKRMLAGCEQYDGTAINAIDWRGLDNEKAAMDFAIGCRFAPHYLDGLIASIYAQRNAIHRPLLRVNLGSGRVTGETARMARELVESGIEITGIEIN
jgi:hypothetical protein